MQGLERDVFSGAVCLRVVKKESMVKYPMFRTLLSVFILFTLVSPKDAYSKGEKGFDPTKITKRKSLEDAYYRWKKIYRPYNASHSPLKPRVAKNLERLFSLSDLAVVEKVVLLEIIGKIDQEEMERDAPHKDYYEDIFSEIKKLDLKDKRLVKIREDLLKAIQHHRDVLYAWLEAARKDEVHKVKNKSGRWVHPGTGLGDKIINQLYHNYVKKEFSNEYSENIEAFSRHFCVLVF